MQSISTSLQSGFTRLQMAKNVLVCHIYYKSYVTSHTNGSSPMTLFEDTKILAQKY